jgi:hypothetical protein
MGETSRRLKLGGERLEDLLEWGDELSARYAQVCAAGTWNFMHVAAAQHAQTGMFVTCDGAQAELALRAGGMSVHLFKQKSVARPSPRVRD